MEDLIHIIGKTQQDVFPPCDEKFFINLPDERRFLFLRFLGSKWLGANGYLNPAISTQRIQPVHNSQNQTFPSDLSDKFGQSAISRDFVM